MQHERWYPLCASEPHLVPVNEKGEWKPPQHRVDACAAMSDAEVDRRLKGMLNRTVLEMQDALENNKVGHAKWRGVIAQQLATLVRGREKDKEPKRPVGRPRKGEAPPPPKAPEPKAEDPMEKLARLMKGSKKKAAAMEEQAEKAGIDPLRETPDGPGSPTA